MSSADAIPEDKLIVVSGLDQYRLSFIQAVYNPLVKKVTDSE